MKKIFLLTMLMLFSSMAMADTLKVNINGMVCAFCANGVEKKFKKVKGVKSVDVSLETKLVTVVFEGEIPVDDKKVTEMITGAGYQVAQIQRVVK